MNDKNKIRKEFKSKLFSIFVISDDIKKIIYKKYCDTIVRLNKEDVSKIKIEDFWIEYIELEKNLKFYTIFSNDFYSFLYQNWFGLINTYKKK